MGTTFKDTDEYIRSFPEETQEMLYKLRALIRKAAPQAEEKIGYGMPSYKLYGRQLLYFAGHEKHIGLYATPTAQIAFEKELSGYKTGKGSVQFPLGKPLPVGLITKIIKFRIEENLQKSKTMKK
ncbi:MAG: DUF1801 domain-containing protein [Bacteroidota bacterium]